LGFALALLQVTELERGDLVGIQRSTLLDLR
jgi:hypothetical protein